MVLNIYILNKAKLCSVVVLVYISLTDFFHMLFVCYPLRNYSVNYPFELDFSFCCFNPASILNTNFLFNEKFASIFSYI